MKIRPNNTITPTRFPAAYLTLVLATGVLAAPTSHAQVTQITSISGITLGAADGGLADGGAANITLVPGGGTTTIRNNAYSQTGFMEQVYQPAITFPFSRPATPGLEFALASNNYSSPAIFGQDATIDSSALWTYGAIESSEFKTTTYPVSPDFGPDSYIAFRSGGGAAGYNYGYLEVTWSSTTDIFTIDGGAYESTPDVAITTPSEVPEPGTTGVLALGSGAMLLLRRRRASV